MKTKDLKYQLFHGTKDRGAAWYDRPTKPVPSASIQTPWGVGKLDILGDYTLDFRLPELVTIHRIQYEIHCYLNIRLSTEEYHLSDSSRRVNRVKDNGERVLGGYPTEKARAIISDTIKPILVEWAEDNGQLILEGYTLEYDNAIAQARHKLDAIQEEIKQRYQYLDLIEQELKTTGNLSDEDKSQLRDIWGRFWKFS